MRRSTSVTGSRASSVSSSYRGDGANSVGSDNEGRSSLYEYTPDKALSQLSLNPSPSVDDLLAAAAANSGNGTDGKWSPKNGENPAAGDESNATVGATTSRTPPKTAPTTKLRVKIKRYHAVARWTWNVAGVNPTDTTPDDGSTISVSRQRMSVDFPPDEEEEVCTICQSAFEGTAPGTKFPGDECPVVWGKCGHSFHLSCVSTWLGDKTTCPYCRAEWEFGADQPVNDRSDEEDGEEDGDDDGDEEEADTSGERSGGTIPRTQRQYPTFEDSFDEGEGQSGINRGQEQEEDEEEAEEEEEDDFWDSDGESYENESDEEESDSEAEELDDSENDASRSSSPLFGADSSESSESIGDGRSYRYATP